MAYLIVVNAVESVTLPPSAFASQADNPPQEWKPSLRCTEVLAHLSRYLDDVQEFEGHGPIPARTYLCRARNEKAVEVVLHALALRCGIGNDDTPACGSVSVMTLDLARPRQVANSVAEAPAALHESTGTKGMMHTAATRILADKVLLRILAGSTTSFDFYVLVAMASILAAIGLATNNTVVIVAAMLVSPLMGPILGITFGLFVGDKVLLWRSSVAELQGLLLAAVVGFICSGVATPWSSSLGWPTSEMSQRGDTWNLLIGLAIAVPSGAGVALSMTGDNASSLVGVAISASLLPPMVNAGMCWLLAIAAATFKKSLPLISCRFCTHGRN
jgi:uncharacterized hydrophobic protein (TIGR00271 family)